MEKQSKYFGYTSIFILSLLFGISCACEDPASPISSPQWITVPEFQDTSMTNSWLAFNKTFNLKKVPKLALTKIAADTKYWLWINDTLIIREGGLKWGPSPSAYYEDAIDLAPYFKKGKNELSILVWYMGKNSMSHKNSGQAGLWVSSPDIGLSSDSTWLANIHPAFGETEPPYPNWRLSESNIHFDARKIKELDAQAPLFGLPKAARTQMAIPFTRNQNYSAVKRPIPFWKDFGLKNYTNTLDFPFESQGDTLILDLPYNAQVTPYFYINAKAGLQIDIRTDNYKGGSTFNVRTAYITAEGPQHFETPGWMNGHQIRYYFPKGIEILDLKYRETGYQSEFAGAFECNDPFFNTLWEKARRTLYITMRDNYMDCPDRERAQWWGDVVLESGETFYALDRQSDLLTKKGILELMDWQKTDQSIYSPIPAGNWDKELPTQMLASVGYYGFWNYYLHTGDSTTIQEVYPKIKSYLSLWETEVSGLVIPRSGGWTWGDWGANKDMPIIFNGWYYLALKGFREMAALLGETEDKKAADAKMQLLAEAFQETFWNGTAFRSPSHQGATDDRAQALAVITGIATKAQYPAIKKVLAEEYHASPYFEKYICEALFIMDYPDDALARLKKRFSKMVESPISTLWEGWSIGSATWGGGTYNHAWSGGGLTLLSQKVAGIEPLEPGYKVVQIRPQLGNLTQVNAKVETVLGTLSVDIKRFGDQLIIDYQEPEGMKIIIKDSM